MVHDDEEIRHLCRAGPNRERQAIIGWLPLFGEHFARLLGVRFPFWCGLFLERRHVYPSNSRGDVDIVLGPLSLNVSQDDVLTTRNAIEAELCAAAAKHGPQFANLRAPPSRVNELMLHQFAHDGLIEWPPPVDQLVAIEVKASYFDLGRQQMRSTKSGRRHKLLGQTQMLVDAGFHRVAVLEFTASTIPTSDSAGGSAWLSAADAMNRAATAATSLDPPPLPLGVGHFRVALAPVPGKAEHLAGAGGYAQMIREPSALGGGKIVGGRGLQRLRERLEACGRPRRYPVYVNDISGAWRTDPFPRP